MRFAGCADEAFQRGGRIHRTIFGFQRLLAKRFPYAIYYRLINGEVVMFRVLDCRRDPKWIRTALGKGAEPKR